MAAPRRPSSPTSLLWAYQLKREHKYLLEQIQSLQSSKKDPEDLVKGAQAAAKETARGEAAAIAQQVKALEAGFNKRLADMEKTTARKLDDMKANLENVMADSQAKTVQIVDLQKDGQTAAMERQRVLQQSHALLLRVVQVEEGLKKYQASLELLGKTIDRQVPDLIKEQLDGLRLAVTKNGSQITMMAASIQELEQTSEDLKKANAMAEQKLAEKATKMPAPSSMTADHSDEVEGENQQRQCTPSTHGGVAKKSHKWGGSGADRDIVLQGAKLLKTNHLKSAPAKSTTASQLNETSKQLRVLKGRSTPPKKSNPVPKPPFAPGVRNLHGRMGRGADQDIVAARSAQDSTSRKRGRASEDEDAPRAKKTRKAAGGIAKLHSSEAEFDASKDPSSEPVVVETPVKRGRGRAHKHVGPGINPRLAPIERFPSRRDSEQNRINEYPNQKMVTRGKRQQDHLKMQTQNKTKGDLTKSGPTTRRRKKAQKDELVLDTPSPVRSSPPAPQAPVTMKYDENVESEIEVEPRRMIFQDDV